MTTQYDRGDDRFEIITTDADPGLQFVVQPDTSGFSDLWRDAVGSADEFLRAEWLKTILEWLDAKEAKSKSPHTRRNYERVLKRWMEFVAGQRNHDGSPLMLWHVDSSHVQQWQSYLGAHGAVNGPGGLSANSVNHHLSVVSSFYSFVIHKKRMVNGIEIDLFVDRVGRARANPFKVGNLQRERTKQYDKANPLSIPDIGKLLQYLEERQHSLIGARNYALILSYMLTGWRNSELLRMRWADIRPNRSQPGTFIFAWKGKGGKEKDDVIPARAYHAIVHYLKLAGRWLPGHEEGLQPDDYIWTAVVTHGRGNLRGQSPADSTGSSSIHEKPITGGNALQIFRNALKGSGIKHPERYRIHDLRHTYARILKETGADLQEIKDALNHSNLNTTDLYTRTVLKDDPVDTRSEQIYQQIKGF